MDSVSGGGVDVIEAMAKLEAAYKDNTIHVASLKESQDALGVELRNRVDTSRKHIRLLTWLFILVAVMAVALGLVALSAKSAAKDAKLAHDRASINSAILKSRCEQSNEERLAQRKFWDGIVGLSSQTPRADVTPEQRAQQLAAYEKLRDEAFGIRDCSVFDEDIK